jgi:predicted amino acid dehydrogenase
MQLGDLPVERAAHILGQEGLLTIGVDSTAAVATAHIVVAATSTPDQLITAETPRPDAIICDVSQPPNVRGDVRTRRPDLFVVDGGLVRLPGGRPLDIDLGVPGGVTYACAAETMILAHQLADPRVSRGGRLDPGFVQDLRAAGARLGFALHLPDGNGGVHD